MIKIEHVVLPSPEQMEFVIEGMRNPMNSWDKSDSFKCTEFKDCVNYETCHDCPHFNETFGYLALGQNDVDLMQKLANAGTDHRKFMRMMPVMVRITAPLYWWKEFDTYKVGTVANSCSTMHKITEKEFTLEDFSYEHLINEQNDIFGDSIYARNTIGSMVSILNTARKKYLECENELREIKPMTEDEFNALTEKKKLYWWQIIQLLPSSYNQTRNVMCNYECLKNMYRARKVHKLDEWVELAKWIETLPYANIITGGKE